GGIKLGQVVKFSVIGPNRTTVRAEDGGVFLAGDVVERLIKVAGNGCAVLALEVDVLSVGDLELAHERVVGVGDLGELSIGAGNEEFVGTVDGRDLRDEISCFSQRVVVDHEAASDGTSDLTASRRDAADTLSSVIVGDE